MMFKNVGHQWRLQPIPGRQAACVICAAVDPVTYRLSVCAAFDHDLRGEICPDCVGLVQNAEVGLVTFAKCCTPNDSMMEDR
jgi:hypothetical protein